MQTAWLLHLCFVQPIAYNETANGESVCPSSCLSFQPFQSRTTALLLKFSSNGFRSASSLLHKRLWEHISFGVLAAWQTWTVETVSTQQLMKLSKADKWGNTEILLGINEYGDPEGKSFQMNRTAFWGRNFAKQMHYTTPNRCTRFKFGQVVVWVKRKMKLNCLCSAVSLEQNEVCCFHSYSQFKARFDREFLLAAGILLKEIGLPFIFHWVQHT